MQDNIRRQQQQKLTEIRNQRDTLADLVQKNPDMKNGVEYPPSFSQNEINLLQEYGTMLSNSQSLQNDRVVREQNEKSRIEEDNRRQQNNNWAPMGKATQSSTYQNQYPANFAIDNKLDTFSHTDMGQSWWQVELSKTLSIRKIIVRNRLGTYQIKSRIIPFKITIINNNGASVGEKTFNDIQDTFTWDDIYLIGKVVKVELINQNYLHMAEVEVYGKEAQDCPTYLNKYDQVTQMINQKLLKYSSVSPDLNRQKDNLKKLSDSCQKLSQVDQSKRKELIADQAKAYDAVLQLQQQEKAKKMAVAKELMTQIEAAQKQEALAAAQAKKLGLPPPPPRYTDAEIAQAKQDLTTLQPKDMTTDQKAQCMGLLNDATQKRSAAEELGQVAQYIPFLIPAAKSKGDDSESAWSKYNTACES
jgi:hypothetical protein